MNLDFFLLIDNLFNFNQSATFVNYKFNFLEIQLLKTSNVEYKVVSSA